MSARVLVIEDDPRIRSVLDRGLRLAGYRTTLADARASGTSAWAAGSYEVVVLDVMLPDGDGLELLAERRAAGDTTPVLILSAREEGELSDRATAAGATDHLTKPYAYHELLDRIERLLGG